MKLSVKHINFIFYLLLWSLLFLLGSYIGRMYRLIYIFLTFILIINIIHFIISINSIYYYQLFSTEHPKKGQKIEYKLTIENRMYFIPCFIEITYHETLTLDKHIPKIKASSSNNIYFNFSLPYRGIYNVGIKKIICSDILNIFTFNLAFWPRTFYVYPKINSEINIKKSGAGEIFNKKNISNKMSTDLLDSIEQYRPGNKLSHISWKHFASYSEPYVKKFYSEECSNTYIFLDRTKLPENRKGPADDMAIEILCSIIQNNIYNGSKTIINCWKQKEITERNFNDFYKDSIYIDFLKSEFETIIEYKTQNYQTNNSVAFITTFESNFFLDFEFIRKFPNLTIYVVTTNLNREKEGLLSDAINKLSEYVEIICINQ